MAVEESLDAPGFALQPAKMSAGTPPQLQAIETSDAGDIYIGNLAGDANAVVEGGRSKETIVAVFEARDALFATDVTPENGKKVKTSVLTSQHVPISNAIFMRVKVQINKQSFWRDAIVADTGLAKNKGLAADKDSTAQEEVSRLKNGVFNISTELGRLYGRALTKTEDQEQPDQEQAQKRLLTALMLQLLATVPA